MGSVTYYMAYFIVYFIKIHMRKKNKELKRGNYGYNLNEKKGFFYSLWHLRHSIPLSLKGLYIKSQILKGSGSQQLSILEYHLGPFPRNLDPQWCFKGHNVEKMFLKHWSEYHEASLLFWGSFLTIQHLLLLQ